MCLRLLQKHGHKPIVLLGGGTTRIGDPSGKDKTRKILTEKEIETILLETLKTNPDYIVIIDHMNPKCHLFLKLKNKVIIL